MEGGVVIAADPRFLIDFMQRTTAIIAIATKLPTVRDIHVIKPEKGF